MRIAQAIRSLIGPIELIHAEAGPRLLRLARLGVFGLWILKLLLDPLWRLADLPPELIVPTGPLSLLSTHQLHALFTPAGLSGFLLITFCVLILCLIKRAFLVSSTLAAILLTFYASIMRSFGPAVHTDIVLLLAVYVFAGFSWADAMQAKGNRARKMASWAAYPLVTLVALLCLSYFLVGINRLFSGGLQIFTGDTMEVWAIDASLRAYYFNTNIGWHLPEWPFLALMLKLGLPAVTLFEIAAPLCLVSSHFRWIFIPFMLSFHLLSLVFMNIFFFDDMLVYLLLVDWSRRFPALRAQVPVTDSSGPVP